MSGVISSVVTNSAAMVAVSSLNLINSQLSTVQNAVSTGYSVSSAMDNGAAYAVAQSVRTDISGLTAANQQLGDTQGLLSTTSTSLNNVSNMMQTMKATLVNLSNQAVTGSQRQQYIQQYQSNLQNIQASIQDANYNGRTLVGNIAGSNGTFSTTAISVVSNGSGGSFSIASTGMSTIYHALSFTSTQLSSATSVAAFLTATGTFSAQVTNVGTAMNTYGNLSNLVNNQITFNQNKMTALTNGLGALVDANMAQESAKLQSLQIQQQLATSSLSIADQSPSLLVKLFP
jgi:flagellin